jgi:hypothetical protein
MCASDAEMQVFLPAEVLLFEKCSFILRGNTDLSHYFSVRHSVTPSVFWVQNVVIRT